MYSRRDFLRAASLVGFAPTIPTFLGRTARAADAEKDRQVLVVIQLDGGNDGINTVVPFKDEGYAQHRKKLRLSADRLHKLDAAVGLHPSMRSLNGLWNDGQLAVIQGVGYPNPSRSHDVSMSVWHSARPQQRDQLDYGWLGRTLDKLDRHPANPDAVFTQRRAKPLALTGRKCRVASFASTEEMRLEDPSSTAEAAEARSSDLEQFVTRSTLDAYATSRRFQELQQTDDAASGYPASKLAQRLKLIARLLKSGWSSRVYYTVQPGYDTHAAQLFQHSRLLRELSEAISAFQSDLQGSRLDDRVVTMCFSEFGRRVSENGSAGTDHGTAGPMFAIGKRVKGGLYGKTPSLIDLAGDNLKVALDFRRVYATLIQSWLGADTAGVLAQEFEPLEFLSV